MSKGCREGAADESGEAWWKASCEVAEAGHRLCVRAETGRCAARKELPKSLTGRAERESFDIGRAAQFRVSGGSFFQVNRFLVEELVKVVTANRSGS